MRGSRTDTDRPPVKSGFCPFCSRFHPFFAILSINGKKTSRQNCLNGNGRTRSSPVSFMFLFFHQRNGGCTTAQAGVHIVKELTSSNQSTKFWGLWPLAHRQTSSMRCCVGASLVLSIHETATPSFAQARQRTELGEVAPSSGRSLHAISLNISRGEKFNPGAVWSR